MHSASPVLLFGNPDFFQSFKNDIKHYCKAQAYHFKLTDAEIEHLLWNVGNIYHSPEAGKNSDSDFSHLPFEVKRSITRCYSFVLILRGDETSYRDFVRAQPDAYKLSYEDFQSLADEAAKLSLDTQAVIRATSFIVGSATLRQICNDHLSDESQQALIRHNLPTSISNDGEEFISQFAVLASIYPNLTPITKTFSSEQNALLSKAFWPNLHMRWLYSSEGANNMTSSLAQGIRENRFNQHTDLPVWTWRWRLNIAGFQGGPSAKFYDRASHQLIQLMLTELNFLFNNTNHPFLSNYLINNFHETRIVDEQLCGADKAFLGHLISYFAYFHRIDIFHPENATALLTGYKSFIAAPSDQQLIHDYDNACRNVLAITPTYVPGVLDTALGLFKSHLDAVTSNAATDHHPLLPDKLDMARLFDEHTENISPAIFLTTQFMCQFSATLYSQFLNQRVSCMKLAQIANLKPVVETWIKNSNTISFELGEAKDGIELKAEHTPIREIYHARNLK